MERAGVEVWWGVHGYIRRLRGDIMEVVEVWWSRYLGCATWRVVVSICGVGCMGRVKGLRGAIWRVPPPTKQASFHGTVKVLSRLFFFTND